MLYFRKKEKLERDFMKFLYLNVFMLWSMLCIGMGLENSGYVNPPPLKRTRCYIAVIQQITSRKQPVKAASSQAFSPLTQPIEVPCAPLLKPCPAPAIPLDGFSLDSYEAVTQAPASPN
jgi:hypothetical protein